MSEVETNQEEKYWNSYIRSLFRENSHTFCEFEINRMGNVKFEFDNVLCFADGYKLKSASKSELIPMVIKYIQSNYPDSQYFISTRAKDDSSNYYLVVSIIQFAKSDVDKKKTE